MRRRDRPTATGVPKTPDIPPSPSRGRPGGAAFSAGAVFVIVLLTLMGSWLVGGASSGTAAPTPGIVHTAGERVVLGVHPAACSVASQALNVQMTPGNGTGPLPLTVTWNISAPSSTPPYSVNWDFGDYSSTGLGGTFDLNFSHSYVNSGNFTASVTIDDSASPCHEYDGSFAIHALATGPVGSISISPASLAGAAPLVGNFTATVTGAGSNYAISWSGDSMYPLSGTGGYFNATFPQKGSHYVDAYLSDGAGVNVAYAQVLVNVTGVSVLSASATPSSGTVPLNVTFRAVVNNSPLVPSPYTIKWRNWDGAVWTGATVNQTFIYPPPWGGGLIGVDVGLYTSSGQEWAWSAVTVTLWPNQTGDDGGPLLVYVDPGPGGVAPYSAHIQVTGYGGVTPYNLSLCDVGGGCWDTLSGWNGSLLTIDRTFATAGEYSFWADVHDAKGTMAGTTLVGLSVSAPNGGLWATVSSGNHTGNAPLTVRFDGAVGGGTPPYSLVWSFGDGSNSSTGATTSVSHTYTARGDYGGQLTVSDSVGTQFIVNLTEVVVTGAPVTLSNPGPGSTSGGPTGPTPPLGWTGQFTRTVGGSPALPLAIGGGLFALFVLTAVYRRRLRRQGEALVRLEASGDGGASSPQPARLDRPR